MSFSPSSGGEAGFSQSQSAQPFANLEQQQSGAPSSSYTNGQFLAPPGGGVPGTSAGHPLIHSQSSPMVMDLLTPNQGFACTNYVTFVVKSGLVHTDMDNFLYYHRNCQLCDVTLVAGASPEEQAESEAAEVSEGERVEMAAHRAVLAACCPYFCAMFTGEMSEARQQRVYIQGVNARALSALVDYIYTSEIHITEENVQILLPAASLLQLNEVRQACCEFLKSQLHPSNCLGIRDFADLHGCDDLLHYANAFTEQHFGDLVFCEEFLSLSAEQVGKLISSDRLTASGEEKVFESVMQWVRYDPERRKQYLPSLMEYVRLPLLSQEYLLDKVDSEDLVKECPKCKDYLIEALKFHLLKNDQKLDFKSPRVKPRQPLGLPKLMVVIGGQAPKAIRNVDVYDFQSEKWNSGVAVLNGCVYAVGGFNGSLRVRTVDVYDPMRDTWCAAPAMEARRSTLGVSVLGGRIFAVGGFDGSTGYLYAVGGYDGQSRQCLSSVERYEPKMDRWIPVMEMNTRRSGAGVTVIDGKLYAVGGHDGPVVKKSGEVFDVELGYWKPVSDMSLCRRNAGVVALNGLLYAVGGDDGSSNLVSVEVYNPQSDGWSMLPSCMQLGRSYAGVAIISKAIP